jgi:hypothetical protein
MLIFVKKKASLLMNSWSMDLFNLIIHHSYLKGKFACRSVIYYIIKSLFLPFRAIIIRARV